jgi:hypothetical protein
MVKWQVSRWSNVAWPEVKKARDVPGVAGKILHGGWRW